MSTLSTPTSPAVDGALLHGVAPLPHLGLIRAQGPDAAKFLHGQLTQDFALLGLSEARLAAFCSAKGRMLASFVGFKRSHEEVLLVCSLDVLAATLKRLSMFVLRAQVKLSDASAEFQLCGVAGPALPGLPDTPWRAAADGQATWVRLYPAAGLPRALWVAPRAGDPPVSPPPGAPLDTAAWQWLEVMSGVVTITQPVVEAFVPQMLNYESIGGVNFKKGCYPGQEIVARSQYLGKLKRRSALAGIDSAAAQAGDEVFSLDDPGQPCGMIVNAAPNGAGGVDALVEMKLAALEGAEVRLGSAGGAPLRFQPMPYKLDALEL